MCQIGSAQLSDIMSLREIDKSYSVLHIAGREYRVRYSLNALLCLEVMYKPLSDILKTAWMEWSAEDVLQLVRAAFCSCSWNRKAVSRRDFDAVAPSLMELGELIQVQDLSALRVELIAAILDAMPKPSGNEQPPTKAFHEGHQRALFCDIMGRSEREYWNSTNREIADKIGCYLEVKGEKEAPTLVRRYGEMKQGSETI